MVLRKNNFLYIDLSEKELKIALMQQVNNDFILKNFETYAVDFFAVHQGVIHNPNVILESLNVFLKNNRLTKINAVIACSWLSDLCDDVSLRLAMLQLVLCFKKSQINVNKIFNLSLFDGDDFKIGEKFSRNCLESKRNLIDLILPTKSIYRFVPIFVFLLVAVITIVTFYLFQCQRCLQLCVLENERSAILKEIKKLESKTHNFDKVKKIYESKEKAVKKILQITENKTKYTKTLIKISQVVPENICLSEIQVNSKKEGVCSKMLDDFSRNEKKSVSQKRIESTNKKTKDKKPAKFINISGYAKDPSDVMVFVKNLAPIPQIEKMEMGKIQQKNNASSAAKEPGEMAYFFELDGVLKG